MSNKYDLMEITHSSCKWGLKTDDKECFICRHCRNKMTEGYFCPNDKQVSCNLCKQNDNSYGHARNWIKKENEPHEHFKVKLIEVEI